MAVSNKGEASDLSTPWWEKAAHVAGFVWRLPKTPGGWLKYAGSAVSDYAITKEKKRWENLMQGFDGMDCVLLAKGAADVISQWMVVQRQDMPVEFHLSRLEAIVLALDEVAHLPLEKAMTRFVASKVALVLEGYNSKLGEPTSRYQRYQKQAKVFLASLPMKNYQGLSQKEIFLGKPFSPESIYIACGRFLDSASVELGQAELLSFLAQWEEREANKPEDFYAKLFATTHRQEDSVILNSAFDTWFNEYQQFMLSRINNREKWISKGFKLLGTPRILTPSQKNN